MKFAVRIEGENLSAAMARLNGSGIPTIGGFPAYFAESGPPPGWQLDRLSAVLDAETAAEAESRVKDNLPPDAEVAAAEPLSG